MADADCGHECVTHDAVYVLVDSSKEVKLSKQLISAGLDLDSRRAPSEEARCHTEAQKSLCETDLLPVKGDDLVASLSRSTSADEAATKP